MYVCLRVRKERFLRLVVGRIPAADDSAHVNKQKEVYSGVS